MRRLRLQAGQGERYSLAARPCPSPASCFAPPRSIGPDNFEVILGVYHPGITGRKLTVEFVVTDAAGKQVREAFTTDEGWYLGEPLMVYEPYAMTVAPIQITVTVNEIDGTSVRFDQSRSIVYP